MSKRFTYFGSLLSTITRCFYTTLNPEVIDMGDIPSIEYDDFTVSIRVKRVNAGGFDAFLSYQYQYELTAGNRCGMGVRFSGAGNKITININTPTLNSFFNSTLSYSSITNEYVITFVKDGANLLLYVDGVLADTFASAVGMTFTSNYPKRTGLSGWWNGNTSSWIQYADIEVADFRIYNNALSSGDVALVSARSYAPVGMVANWIGDNATDSWDGTNWTVVDSVSGNNGTTVDMEETDRTCVIV